LKIVIFTYIHQDEEVITEYSKRKVLNGCLVR